jgi:diacylglycerol kinase family enzyme
MSANASLVIVNANASQLRDSATRAAVITSIGRALLGRDGIEPSIVETAARSETRPAVEAALHQDAPAVIGVGGDGTLRDIARLLAGRGVPLGIVAAGTGNQLAAVLGLPRKAAAAAETLRTAVTRAIDLGQVRVELRDGSEIEEAFTIGCGVGFDARLMATTPHDWKQRLGKAAYFLQAATLAAGIDVVPYRIDVDGETFDTEASVALVGNIGQLVPGRLDLRLPLVPDDGLLDLIVVGARGPIHGLRGLVDQLQRTSLGGVAGSDSLRLRGRVIAIHADPPQPLQVDGDYLGEGSLTATLLPGALEVLVPPAGRHAPVEPPRSARRLPRRS